jgi:hypothetical protein
LLVYASEEDGPAIDDGPQNRATPSSIPLTEQRGQAKEKPSSFDRISTDFQLANLLILSKTIDS